METILNKDPGDGGCVWLTIKAKQEDLVRFPSSDGNHEWLLVCGIASFTGELQLSLKMNSAPPTSVHPTSLEILLLPVRVISSDQVTSGHLFLESLLYSLYSQTTLFYGSFICHEVKQHKPSDLC